MGLGMSAHCYVPAMYVPYRSPRVLFNMDGYDLHFAFYFVCMPGSLIGELICGIGTSIHSLFICFFFVFIVCFVFVCC